MLHTFAGVFLGAATFIGGLLGFGPDTVATVPQTQTAAIAETRSALAPEETVSTDTTAETPTESILASALPPSVAPAPHVLGTSTVTMSPSFLAQFSQFLQSFSAYLASPAVASGTTYPRYGGYVPSTGGTIIGTIPANTVLASPAITGGTITDASSGSFDALSAGTLTLTSALTGTDATFSGTLTAGTLNVASVSSAGALIGPYFTATSTTATSTFAGAVGIGTTSPNYTLDVNGTINIPLDTDIKAGGIQWMHLSASQVARLYGTAYQLYTGTVRTLRQQVDSSGNFDFNSGQMYIQQSTGNVGIGTTTPGALLGVNGNILGAGTLALTGTTGTTTIASGQGFTIGGSQFVLQQGSGNVGVGTASPAYLLETQSNSNPTINIKNTSASGYSQLFFSNTNGVGRGQIFVNGSTESGFGQPNSMNIYAGGAYDIGLWTNSVERIIVKDTGQVGIGTTTPWGNLSIATGAHTYVEIGRGAAGNNAELVFSTNGALNWMAGLGDDVSNNFYLSTNVGTPSLGAKLTVTTGGNVGVGTTTPNANLVVNGTTGRKLFQVATSTNQSIFTITENAHVGIGTAAPVASLHVLSTDTDGQLRLTYDDSGYSTFFTNLNGNTRFFSSGGNLWVGNSNGTQNTAVSIYNSNSGVSMNGLTLGNMKTTAGSNIKINFVDWSETEISSMRSVHGGTGIGSLAFYTNNAGGSTERVRIDNQGNIGIGTTSPSSLLSLSQNLSATVGLTIENQNPSAAWGSAITFAGKYSGGWARGQIVSEPASNSGGDLTFKTANSSGVLTTRLYIEELGDFNFNSGDVYFVNSSGKVGIGTTSPQALLGLQGAIGVNSNQMYLLADGRVAFNGTTLNSGEAMRWTGQAGGASNTIFDFCKDSSGSACISLDPGATTGVADIYASWISGSEPKMHLSTYSIRTTAAGITIDTAGNVGIGTTTPTAELTTTGTVRFASLGSAGANLITDALGNVTVSSDERLKDKQGDFTRGLDAINSISPVLYKWRPETGLDTQSTYAGFFAQNVQTAIPEAVAQDSRGYLTLADRPILAAVVNAIKELAGSVASLVSNDAAQDAEIRALKERIAALEARPVVNPDGSYTITVSSQTAAPQGAVDSEQVADGSEDTGTATSTPQNIADSEQMTDNSGNTEEATTTEPETAPEDPAAQTASPDIASSTPQ